MADHFNRLTPAEDERLALLVEELGEAIQAAGKVLRHGYSSVNPDAPDIGPTNRLSLERELGDVLCAIRFLCDSGDISAAETINALSDHKMRRVQRYLHHHVVEEPTDHVAAHRPRAVQMVKRNFWAQVGTDANDPALVNTALERCALLVLEMRMDLLPEDATDV